MKNWKLFLSAFLCMSVLFVSCSDDNGDPDDPDEIKATVRYEASVSDNVNYKIRVMYMDEYDGILTEEMMRDHLKLKEVIVESPFSCEIKYRKTGTFLFIGAVAEPRNGLVTPYTQVKSAIYVDGKLCDEKTGEMEVVAQYILGTP